MRISVIIKVYIKAKNEHGKSTVHKPTIEHKYISCLSHSVHIPYIKYQFTVNMFHSAVAFCIHKRHDDSRIMFSIED